MSAYPAQECTGNRNATVFCILADRDDSITSRSLNIVTLERNHI